VRLKLLSSSPELDLAVLRIMPTATAPVTYPHLRFAPSLSLSYGTTLSLVGFPVAGGSTVTVTQLDVVGLDDSQGWVKVDGAMMRGASGGAVVNAEGGLIGIPAKVQVDQAVPFFGDDGLPHGTVTLGTVGFVRSSEVVLKFLADNSLMTNTGPGAMAPPGLKVSGQVTEKGTGKPIAGAVIGLLAPDALAQSAYVRSHELMAYAKSDGEGGFALNRLVRSDKYRVKIVHPKYKTLITEVVIDSNNTEFDIELVRE
jgi:S1-C subfamily serine protease